jgi:hypothetical protein
MMYNGYVRVVGLRFKNYVFNPVSKEELKVLMDVVTGSITLENLEFSPDESFGEYPMLGSIWWVLIKDKVIKIIEDDKYM